MMGCDLIIMMVLSQARIHGTLQDNQRVTTPRCRRCEVVERRARHRLARTQARLHLVEGFLAAMAQLDAVVQVRVDAEGFVCMSVCLRVRFHVSLCVSGHVCAGTGWI